MRATLCGECLDLIYVAASPILRHLADNRIKVSATELNKQIRDGRFGLLVSVEIPAF